MFSTLLKVELKEMKGLLWNKRERKKCMIKKKFLETFEICN